MNASEIFTWGLFVLLGLLVAAVALGLAVEAAIDRIEADDAGCEE